MSVAIIAIVALSLVFAYSPMPPRSGPAAAIDETDLVGSWVHSLVDPNDPDPDCRLAESDDFCYADDSEEINFSIDGGSRIFNSFIHHRPELSECAWKLEGSNVAIDCHWDVLADSFRIVSLSKKKLVIDREGYVTEYLFYEHP